MDITITSSGADFAKLTADASKRLVASTRVLGRDIAKVGRRALLADVKRSRPAGLRFGRSRLGASTKVDPNALGTTVILRASPAGFWSITEYGAVAHPIEPRRARALRFDGVYAAHVSHPGTTGRPYWASAETAIDDAVTPLIVDTADEALGVV